MLRILIVFHWIGSEAYSYDHSTDHQATAATVIRGGARLVLGWQIPLLVPDLPPQVQPPPSPQFSDMSLYVIENCIIRMDGEDILIKHTVHI